GPSQPQLLQALTPIFNLSAIRPVMNMTTSTNVSMYFILYGVLGVVSPPNLESDDFTGWWKNEFVTWDPVQCGTDKISLPRTKFWAPDIVINEFMDENTAPVVPFVYLYSNGMLHDALPVRVVSSCNLDIYTFPFDIQNCTLTFNSYIHQSELSPHKQITQTSKNVITTMGEWELLDISSHKPETDLSDDKYIDHLDFHVVRRRAMLYVINLLIPSCFLITVDLFSFMLPPHSVDRSSFKMTLILGYTVFLLIMNDLLPITGNTIPLINVFFSLCLAMMVASLLETILITNLLSNSDKLPPLPRWVSVVFLQCLGHLVCLPPKTKHRKHPGFKLDTDLGRQGAGEGPMEPAVEGGAIRLQVEQKLGNSQSAEEWMQVGFIIDRLLFGLYIIFITVSFFTIIIIWVNSYYN
uniref:Uncharacterized protein n=1 Tax=Takifugu rubripes TaxID=31033 RepID=H2V6D7_TAKRU